MYSAQPLSTHAHLHTYAHTYTRAHTYTHTSSSNDLLMRLFTNNIVIHAQTDKRTPRKMCVCVYVYIYIHI